jgi:AraC-like DNA-binding protein
MIRKIVVEINIGQDSPSYFMSQLQQLVSSVFHDLNAECFKFAAFEDENEIVEQERSIHASNPGFAAHQQGAFRIGSLSFNISSSESATNEFIDRCIKSVVENLGNEKYNILAIAQELNVSKPTFFRKIKQITGLSAMAFVRQVKMQVAYRILQTKKYTVSEVAWQCGYSSARHFSKIFYSTFHQYPSKIIQLI